MLINNQNFRLLISIGLPGTVSMVMRVISIMRILRVPSFSLEIADRVKIANVRTI